MKRFYIFAALVIFSALVGAQTTDNLKAYPAAEQGMVRHVLQLAKQADEAALRVELIAGKTVWLDRVNRYFFIGSIEQETIEGWGFTRYILRELGPMAGTRMGVDPNAPKVNRFVTLGGEAYLIRYNSRLPVVVYAPEGVEIRYRVWRAQAQSKTIGKG